MREINKIIVHCSATPENRDVSVETIRKWHVEERGWSDIGYHFVITLDGTIKEGRPVARQGAHTRGYNKGSIGICYIGGVDIDLKAKDTRNEAQKESLVNLICDLKDKYGGTVYGHNDFSSKECPSFNAKKEYENISLRF